MATARRHVVYAERRTQWLTGPVALKQGAHNVNEARRHPVRASPTPPSLRDFVADSLAAKARSRLANVVQEGQLHQARNIDRSQRPLRQRAQPGLPGRQFEQRGDDGSHVDAVRDQSEARNLAQRDGLQLGRR